jgi:hypothetical protein
MFGKDKVTRGNLENEKKLYCLYLYPLLIYICT